MAEETKKVAEAPKKDKPVKKKSDKPGFFKRIGNFFRDYRSEMKKIVWYPWKNVVRDTGVVMVSLVAAGAVIGVLDLIFTKLVLLLGHIG